jgi:hypothetical protein
MIERAQVDDEGAEDEALSLAIEEGMLSARVERDYVLDVLEAADVKVR